MNKVNPLQSRRQGESSGVNQDTSRPLMESLMHENALSVLLDETSKYSMQQRSKRTSPRGLPNIVESHQSATTPKGIFGSNFNRADMKGQSLAQYFATVKQNQ